MKTFNDFNTLVNNRETLPYTGIFILNTDNLDVDSIINNQFYVVDSSEEADEFDESGQYQEIFECQTFRAIVDNKLEHNPNSSLLELAQAVIYYLENDDFLD